MKRRLLSFLLCICMVITMLPATAYAALLDNEPATNREILAQLEAICGSEEEAERYYALLQQYGLLDEDGSVMDSWTITMDGADVKLSDLRAVLAGDYDPTKLVIVDGTPITLGDLDTVLQIEDYIAYLRRTYFSGGAWTQEQLASLQSLQEQINTRGIMLLGVNDEGTVGASGVDHTVRISVSGADTATLNSSYTVTVSLNKAQKVDVTYSYRALSGSVAATGSDTRTITAGSVRDTFTVNVGDAKGVLNGSGTFVVQVYDVKNALFSDGQDNGSLTVRVSKSDTFKYSDSKSVSLTHTGGYYMEYQDLLNGKGSTGDQAILTNFNNYCKAPTQNLRYSINPLLDAVVDRFGNDKSGVWYETLDDTHFTMTTQVEISDQFFGWILGFGKRAKILEPPAVVDQFAAYLDKVREMY